MYFNAHILATISLYLSVHAQWLQADDEHGLIDQSRSIEDSSPFAAQPYELDEDASDAEFHRRSFKDLGDILYIREAKQTATAAKAGPPGGSAVNTKGGPASSSAGGTKGESHGGSKNGSPAGSSKGGDGSKLDKAGSAKPKFQFSKEQKAKLAAKYGGVGGKGKWSYSPSSGRRYFTNENGQKTRFRQDENGKLKVKQYKPRPSKSRGASSGSDSDASGSGASSDESGGGMRKRSLQHLLARSDPMISPLEM